MRGFALALISKVDTMELGYGSFKINPKEKNSERKKRFTCEATNQFIAIF